MQRKQKSKSETIDIERFRAKPADRRKLAKPRKVAKPRSKQQEFLRGPIPLDWLSPACQLSGAAVRIGLALWFQKGRTRSLTVSLSQKVRDRFGITRDSFYRGLEVLEVEGLVSVERGVGRATLVTILVTDESSN